MSTQHDDGTSGSAMGGFGHAESIEPGVLEDDEDDEDDEDEQRDETPQVADPEGLTGAHDDADDD